jgi:hypothetical protein
MKIGRNDPCPCGSGKKYKKCHLDSTPIVSTADPTDVPPEVLEHLRKFQQERMELEKMGIYINYVKPIVFKGKKVWAIGSRVYFQRPPNETFHEFILFILQQNLGFEWWQEQLKLSFDKRHFIMQCFQGYSEWAEKQSENPENRVGEVWAAVPNGWTRSLTSLAFDVASLIHKQKLPDFLLNRLKNMNEFQGARYEIIIAAIFARLGFEIEFLDEGNVEEKHPEFIARKDGMEVAVEAKSKHRKGVLHFPGDKSDKEMKIKVLNLLHNANLKQINNRHFLIFIDVNYPMTPGMKTEDENWVKELTEARKRDLDENSDDNPKYNGVYFTNFSYHYSGDDISPSTQFITELPLNPQHPISDPRFVSKLFDALNNYGNVPNLDERET